MTDTSAETRSVIEERDLPYPPEKLWRALTVPHLIEAWLMQTDFAPVQGQAFAFRADWGSVACKVLEIEPHRILSYSWTAMGLESVVTWTLTPTATGTHLRMEHSGFPMDRDQAFRGAGYGWKMFLGKFEQVLAAEGPAGPVN
jgi:uncharacterized protein YndB with AHSA1/START domain